MAMSTTLPFCVTSIWPASAKLLAAARVAAIRHRQSPGWTFLGASLGQQLDPGLRFRSSSSIASFSTWFAT